MKIAIYANDIPSTVFIENLIKGLADRGHKIYLYGKYIKNPHYENYPNIYIIKEPKTLFKQFLFVFYSAFKLVIKKPSKLFYIIAISKESDIPQWIYKFNFYSNILCLDVDILHIQWVNSINFLRSFFKYELVKTVVSLRGTHINVTPLFIEDRKKGYIDLFPLIDGFHGVSHAIIKEASKYDPSLPNRAQVAYPAVTIETFNKFKLREAPISGNFKIISIGRHHWKKGYLYAFDAIKLLKDKGVSVIYTIVASGALDEQLLYQIKELGIEDSIKIQGGMDHLAVLDAVQAADVFLLPSVEEGVANVVLEAMAVGTPVVSTDCGGMSEVLRDGENGFMVKSGYSNLLAESLLKVYHLNLDEINKMLLEGHKTIEKNHLLNTQLDNMEILYNQVLKY